MKALLVKKRQKQEVLCYLIQNVLQSCNKQSCDIGIKIYTLTNELEENVKANPGIHDFQENLLTAFFAERLIFQYV